MKHATFFKRFLSLLLVLALMAGNVLPGMALEIGKDETGKTTVSFTRVDNDRVSASLRPNGRQENTVEAEYAATDVVRVSIILEKASTIKAGFSAMDIAANEAAVAYRENLKKEQTNVINQIERATKSSLDVVWNLTLAANIISANVQYGQIKVIENLPGVNGVVIENQYLPETVQTESGSIAPNMATSGSQIGSGMAWNAGYTGAGSRIAVIDTGTDTDHQSLNAKAFEYSLSLLAEESGMSYEDYIESLDLLDAEEIAAVADKLNIKDYLDADKAYFNTKLPFGFNYKDADYDITHDNDDQGGHGSHVAGIATANSWLYNAAQDIYGKALDYCFMQGVAPDAQLLTLKVFGKAGSPYDSDYMAAIEDAVILGADVINLSLGSVAPGRGAHSNPVFQAVMDDLTKSGVVVAISAGNSGPWAETAENYANLGGMGYLYNTDVSQDTLGQPGSFTNSLCVASVENDGMVGYYIEINGKMFVYNEDTRDGQFTNQPFTTIAGDWEYVWIDGVGKAEDWEAVKDVLKGKIALCSRGETNFAEKANLAIQAGAAALFVYNNQSGIINLDLTEYLYTAPVAAITKSQGDAIRAESTAVTDENGNVLYRTGTMKVSNTIGMGFFGSDYYTMSDFSSWGVTGSLELKPEITAPGGNIFSLDGESSVGGYVIMSGTSMASPQVAGMAALMAQYVRENNLEYKTGMGARHLIQSLMMSTAQPLLASEGVYYPVLQQGAGLANVWAAMNADSFITMGEGTNNGAADGKVKVELFDDPDRVGSYTATFQIHNMQNVDKIVNLNADFFIQGVTSDGEHMYMDYSTTTIPMNVFWSIGGAAVVSEELNVEGMDFNGDGQVNADDGQALLDYVTGKSAVLFNKDKADVDGDGDIDSHDVYVFLTNLSTTTAVLPAGGSLEIRVDFTLPASVKEEINEMFPNGTYLQGFLYAETVGENEKVDTTHSIPVLGFFGNWTDPSMFDVGEWTTFATGEDTRIPYIGRTRGNDWKVMYDWDPGYNYSFGGNPLIPDSVYMPERNAMNSADAMDGVSFIAIRNADQSRVVVVNETTGEVVMDQKTGAVNMAYYYGALGWQNSGMFLQTNFSMKDASEGDRMSMSFTLVPEYYIDDEGNVDWDALGEGATRSISWTIDNTAPELFGVSIDVLNNTMTVKASDNQYIAGVGLYNKTGTRVLAQTGAKQDIEKGEVAEYTFSLDKVNGKKFLLQVFDYAMNAATYMIEMQIGEEADLPTMMAYDLVSRHWAGFDKNFVYDYKVGTPKVADADHIFYAATIAEHYAFASTNNGDLYVMPEDDLTDTTFIVNMGQVMYDMAYNAADGEIYAVNEKGDLFTIHKLTGEVTQVGTIGLKTNTLACSPDGVFYCNELGTGKVYSFTLETMDAPELLMEDPYLTQKDPMYGDHNGTEGNMGMEYNPNTDMIAWNSHIEVLMGAYITFAYYYEIDPATGEFTRYADFWHEMGGLMIPDRTGAGGSWADPTNKVMGVKLNRDEINVIRGTSAQLTPNVMPWTASDRTVTWSSADESIATVDKRGVVTGVNAGTTTIRATSNLDPDFYAECVVNVEILNVTIHGTTTDANNNSMFYDWDMSTGESWKPGASLAETMTSASYSTALDVFYMMDNVASKWAMHKVDANGNILQSAENTMGVAMWDMVYNPYFSQIHGEERVSGVYYYYLLSPKNPMSLNSVGFNLGDLASYLVGITSKGYEQQTDENGTVYDTEHLVLLDNDGYVWDFWIYDVAGGGMNALYNITKSDLNLDFPGDGAMDNLYTSLTVGEDGNLYLSTYNGDNTNEIWHLSYDPIDHKYVAVKIAEMGENVYPATITSVTVNGNNTVNTASPKPMYTMAATEITDEELAAASTKRDFSVTNAERDYKLEIHGAGDSKTDTIELSEGENQMDISKMVYYSYTPDEDGTVTLTVSTNTNKWYAMYYAKGADGSYVTLDSTQPEAAEVTAGTAVVIGIRIYDASKWSAVAGTLTINVAFTPVGGSTPDPEQPVDPEDPEIPEEPGTDSLVLGTNDLTSGTKYTYTAAADGRLEFDFVMKDAEGKTIYQYGYSKGDRVKIMINDTYVPNLADTKVSVKTGDTITVELVSVDGGEYTAVLTMTALAAATELVLGDNNIAKKTDYSFIATQDGTLYTTIKELWCDGTYCTEASLSSSVVFKINGTAVYRFENAYEVKAGDEITVLMGTSFGESANAVLNLSYEGFYKHPAGSRGNPYVLDYSQFPTTVEIPAGEAHWFKLTGFYSGYYMDIYGENAYLIIGGQQYAVSSNGTRIPAVTNLQIGNSGTETATFQLYAGIYEGTSGNPKDLVNGEQTVELEPSENYYYDFVATQAGTATFTVSGDNWRFFYSLIGADGTVLVSEEDHRAVRTGDSDTVTVDLATGQSIIIKLATMNSSWSSTGGELTVDFHFTPADGACTHTNTEVRNAQAASCDREGYSGDTYCLDCGVKIKTGETIGKLDHTPGAEATCTTPQICTVCSDELVPALGHLYENGICVRCGAEEPVINPEYALVLGTNELASGNKYTYVVTEEGRLEFDFVIKDSDGKTIYQYAYGKGERVKIMINGNYVTNLVDTKVSVRVGDVVTVELVSVDGGSYTATLTLTGLEPASKLVLGDNDIAKDTDYSFIATKDGTLYLTIKELICDNAYCSEVSLGSSVVFKINGVAVYSFENSYEVKAGDEITVHMGTQFGEPASAVLNLSYEGFYKHPLGSRGNPIVVDYADMPTYTVKIPAGTAYWFKFTGFPASAEIKLLGAEGAYVIYAGETYQVPEGKAMNFGSVRSLQIGNSGTGEASFYLYYSLVEGSVDNPKDLVEGNNSVVLDKSANYYYDFVATENGTITFTVSGDNWRFFYSLFGADGTALVSEEDHRASRGDAATVTVDVTAGQSILLKLGTLNSSWSAPGGEITVNFHFEHAEAACEHTNTEIRNEKAATCTENGYTGDTYCADCGALISEGEVITADGHNFQNGSCVDCGEIDPDYKPDTTNPLVLGKNDLESGVVYSYTVPVDGRMEFAVGSVYNSAGSKQYSWYNGSKLQILINGKAMTASSAKMNVTAGQIITVEIVSLDGDTFTADMTLKEIASAEKLVIGNNNVSQDLEYVFVADKAGTVYVSVVQLLYGSKECGANELGNNITLSINGKTVSEFTKSFEVTAGDEIAIVLKDYNSFDSDHPSAIINLSYEGFYQHPVGSLNNPVGLLYADCPTNSIEIAPGTAAWYLLESYYDESAWQTVYPFSSKYLVVTGEGAYVIVGSTRYDAVNGVVKVLMGNTDMIQIGNDGASAAVFQISVEIPEGHKDNPQDLVEGDNKVDVPKSSTHYFDFIATEDGTVTIKVSGENWKYTFEHYGVDGVKISGKDYYAKNGDVDTQTLEIKAGEKVVVIVGTSQGYSQPGGVITVNFHFEPAQVECQHENTETAIENEVEETCTTDGSYDEVIYCADCGEELSRKTVIVPASGHNFEDGACTECGEVDPDANKVIVNVTVDVDSTNGVVLVTWDPANLKLVDIVVHADYKSIVENDGSVTFGYVVLDGIAAGDVIATLIFEAVDPDAANVTIEHQQINNDSDAPCQHFETEIRNAKDATCTEEGYTGDTYCVHCGELIAEGEVIEMLEHNMVDGECTECGHREYELGDVNGDGVVDTTDAKLIMQLDLGMVDETALNLDAADVNGDGVVDTTDAKLIMQKDLGLIEEFPAEN